MTQEKRQLLLADLCARLPYGLIVTNQLVDNGHICKLNPYSLRIGYFIDSSRIDETKMFLRPLYSITEEEKEYLEELSEFKCTPDKATKKIDFYLSHHIDYRGLIPMGLALEAPEGMYY